MSAEPINDDNPIEAILLTGFPNPQRIGCLPPDIIEGLGQKRILRDDPAWRHIWNCSPCFRAFKTIRDQRLAEVEREHQKQKLFKLAAALAAGLAIFALLYFFGLPKRAASVEAVVIPIDLTNVVILRGSAAPDNEGPLAEFPKSLVELRITLPRFSKSGRYMVAILKSKSEDAAIALGSALATSRAERQTLLLTLDLDLTTADAGRYYLATRLLEPGQDPAYYYPVLISSK